MLANETENLKNYYFCFYSQSVIFEKVNSLGCHFRLLESCHRCN